MAKRILLADVDASVRETLGRVLELEHYEVALAGSGCEALAKLRADLPDLVLMDLNTSDKTGWHALDVMCRIAPRVPILIITAIPHQAKRAAELGAAGLMEKPLHLPRLLQILNDLLAKSAKPPHGGATSQSAKAQSLPASPRAQPSCTGGTC